MNWTEGGLARHSRASKGRAVLLRQKEHFAKARSGLLNANVKKSPSSISFLAHPAHSSPPAHHRFSKSNASGPFSRKSAKEKDPPHSSRYFQDDAALELPTPAQFQRDQAEEETLCQKRRKLLLKGDWTGTNLQKPIQMEFSKPRESLGGPWGQAKSRHAKSSQRRLRHMLGIKYEAVQNRAHEAGVTFTRPISPGQLRVRVGSRERALGGSSNTSPRSQTCRDVESSPRVAHVSRPKHRERRRCRTNLHDAATSDTKRTPRSPELLQPVPQRPFLPSLLCSQSSDPGDAVSTKAQIGILLPDVPPSQVEQNDAWWKFVAEAEHGQGASKLQPSVDQDPVQRDISPGVSQLGLSTGVDGSDKGREAVQGSPSVNDRASMNYGSSPHESLLLSDQLGVATREDVPLGNGSVFASRESKSSSVGSSPPRRSAIVRVEEEVEREKEYGDSETSEDVSQVVLPASCSPTSEDLLAQFYNLANVQEGVEHVTARPVSSVRPSQPEKPTQTNESHGKIVAETREQYEKLQQANSKPCNHKEDENDMWRKFVFGDSDDNLEAAFLEASKETARNLCPSETSTSTEENDMSEDTRIYPEPSRMVTALNSALDVRGSSCTGQRDSSSTNVTATMSISNRATPEASSPDPLTDHSVPNFSDLRESCSNGTSTMESASNRATSGGSSPDPLAEFSLAHTDTTTQTNAASTGSSSSSKAAPSSVTDEFMSRSDDDNGNASLIAHPPSTHENSEVDAYRFARPKPFTGKNIQLDEQRQIALSAPQIRGRNVSRRRQKRAGDGRARIRGLPSFSGDPIEEIEEDEAAFSAKNALKPSFFGSLDTENDL